MLKLYALYKIATKNQENPSGDKPLISAFKANALFQAKHINIETAMLEYIAIVEKEVS
jgi:diazepam-binding inhibitor (GABA receptor modulator, acyl-CoA-binding protein)